MDVQKKDKDMPVIPTLLKKNLELLDSSGVAKEDKLGTEKIVIISS